MNLITSRDNPLFKKIQRLSKDGVAYRKLGLVWIEGDHLCRAALERGLKPIHAVFSESLWEKTPPEWRSSAENNIVLSTSLFAEISSLESPAKIGFVLSFQQTHEIQAKAPTVVLDRLQDTGNVGSILRSASAFGFKQVLALKGTASLWSPKVLRAGMGAHFGLHLVESLTPEQLNPLDVPWLATSVHDGPFLHQLLADSQLPMPCAWLMGHEGHGISSELLERAALSVRIAQPGGEESLNVAAAAAICLHASATQSRS